MSQPQYDVLLVATLHQSMSNKYCGSRLLTLFVISLRSTEAYGPVKNAIRLLGQKPAKPIQHKRSLAWCSVVQKTALRHPSLRFYTWIARASFLGAICPLFAYFLCRLISLFYILMKASARHTKAHSAVTKRCAEYVLLTHATQPGQPCRCTRFRAYDFHHLISPGTPHSQHT